MKGCEDGMFHKIKIEYEKKNLNFNGVGFHASTLRNQFCILHVFSQEIN